MQCKAYEKPKMTRVELRPEERLSACEGTINYTFFSTNPISCSSYTAWPDTNPGQCVTYTDVTGS